MSNGFRHFLGVIAGLVISPLLAGLLVFGVDGLSRIGDTVRPADAGSVELYTRLSLLIVTAVAIALMTGSRLSPLASLIGGLAFTAAGIIWLILPNETGEFIAGFPIKGKDEALRTLIYHGMFLFIGIVLVASSFPPSRWRGRAGHQSGSAPRQPYEPRHLGPPQPEEAEVTFASPEARPPAERTRPGIDVPGYRFLPRDRDEGGERTTQELPHRSHYDG